jgi:hypothetical protein
MRVISRTGRAYPDISAQADRFQVVVGGLVVSVAGTSASAPVRFSPFPPPLFTHHIWDTGCLACRFASLPFTLFDPKLRPE